MPKPTALLKGFEKEVATVRPDANKRVTIFDPETQGLCLRVTPKGRKTYTVVARNPQGKQVWAAVPNGDPEAITLAEARAFAREGVRRIKEGLQPFPSSKPERPPETFADVVPNFMRRHVEKKGLRSNGEIERIFEKYVLPVWRDRAFKEIKRSDVAGLLDDIEDNSGPVMADRTLAWLSKLFNWYAARDDEYSSPVVPGMRRAEAKARARDRILSDDEIRAIWPALEQSGTFGAMLRVCLLTAQRRAKVAGMRWSEIDETGNWTIPTEPREKGNPGSLILPEPVMAVIRQQPEIKDNPYVFAGRGKAHIAGFSASKKLLDEKVQSIRQKAATEVGQDPAAVEPIPGWTIHDLRRTAKSLMARAGVRPDVSERVLGHAIPGVEGTYDRYDYEAEKADALVKLAGLVTRILDPASAKVVPIHVGASA